MFNNFLIITFIFFTTINYQISYAQKPIFSEQDKLIYDYESITAGQNSKPNNDFQSIFYDDSTSSNPIQ
jgi:hypothetical protein